MSETDETVEPEIVGIEEPEEVPEDNQPEIITIDETGEAPEENQPEIVDVDEVEEAEDEAVEEVEEVEEVGEEKKPRPVTSRRPPTQKRPRTTSRSLRVRPSTQRMGTRRHARGGDQKAKLIVMAVTGGLLLLLVVCAIGKAMRKPPPPPQQKKIFIRHQLDRARSLRRQGEALIRKADSAGSPQGKNSYLGQAMTSFRQAQSAYTGLIEQYKGPQYEYLHRESERVMQLLYHCQKSMTLSRN